MTVTLPQAIAGYYAADAEAPESVADFFTLDAVVIDEKRTHEGRDAIAAWKKEASAKFDYAVEPVDAVDEGDRVLVTARVTGNFPGSPVDLRYAFTLEADRIARLEIVP